MKITENTVISLSYTLSIMHPNGDLEFVEQRTTADPLEFVVGKGIVLQKIEDALTNKTPGFEVQLKLRPEDAFGLRKEKLVLKYPIEKLPREAAPQIGMKFQTQGPDGDVVSVIVTALDEKHVTLDGNHPLADAFVQFDIRVLKVRAATPEEISTGEVSSSGLLH